MHNCFPAVKISARTYANKHVQNNPHPATTIQIDDSHSYWHILASKMAISSTIEALKIAARFQPQQLRYAFEFDHKVKVDSQRVEENEWESMV